MAELQLKSCPFCGREAFICGEEVKDYVNGNWARASRKEYWVTSHHDLNCIFGMIQSRAFGIVGGIRYTSEEAAAKAWNRRADCD